MNKSNVYLELNGTRSKKAPKIIHDDTKHYPNKNEAALLRKLKNETGLSEEEIRNIKKYNVMLSEAQKTGERGKRTKVERYYRDIIKLATKKTGLAKEHPETIKVLDEMLNELRNRRKPWYIYSNNYSAKTIIQYYGK